MIKGIIFDLDGTLLDTLDDLYLAVNRMLKSLDEPLRNKVEIRAFLGNGMQNLILKSLKDKNKFDKGYQTFVNDYEQNKTVYTRPYRGIMELLEGLFSIDIKMGIVSNKIDSAVKSLNDTHFRNYIQYAYGNQTGYPLKPNPSLVEKCLNDMNLKKHEVVYVGDSEVDFLTAQNTGIQCILVSWGFRDPSELMALDAFKIIHEPAELLNLLTMNIYNTHQ